MNLWDLLTLLSGASAVGGSLAAVRVAERGYVGLAVGLVVGIAIALLCIIAIRATGKRIGPKLVSNLNEEVPAPPPSGMPLSLVYTLAVVWIFASGAIGMHVVAAILRMA